MTKKVSVSEISIEYVPLSELQRWPRNPKDHDLGELHQSIERFGYINPILVDERTEQLVAGHGRLDALQQMKASGSSAPKRVRVEGGEWFVPVIRGVEFNSDAEAEAYQLADNRLTELGGWIEEDLAGVLSDLAAEGEEMLTGVGWGLNDIDELLAQLEREAAGPAEEDDFEAEPPEEAVSQRGEVYELGPHRLMCGDATDEGDVSRLLDGAEPECIWTDPPYGVEYEGKTRDRLTMAGDDPTGTEALLIDAFTALEDHLSPGARFYVAAPAGPQGTRFRLALGRVGWQLHQCLVWCKDRMVLGHSDYHYQHEDVLYGWLPGPGRVGRGNHEGSRWFADHDETTVFHVDRPSQSEKHPTMKPVGLVAPMIRNSTPPQGEIVDPFLGSGTTLIAAEQLGRTCYAMEIDPRYCDVARQRYADFIGDQTYAP